MFDDTIYILGVGHILGVVYRIMHEVCAPAITPFGASEVDGIASLNLTDIDAVVLVDCVDGINHIHKCRTIMTFNF
jgi:hypothetical protein